MRRTDRIVGWPRPCSVKEVQQFCGLIHYIAHFLPQITEHTQVLTELTTEESNTTFPLWTDAHEQAFKAIKKAVAGHDCLMTINHNQMPDMKIFVTTDASDFQSGAVLFFGRTWESA